MIIVVSMGGMIAMELALVAPEAVSSLALVATCAQVRTQLSLRWTAVQQRLSTEVIRVLFNPLALVTSVGAALGAGWTHARSAVHGVDDQSRALRLKMAANMKLMHGSSVHANRTLYDAVHVRSR
jgi:pimeloyl-ACP methyl ester carboxylesterase